MKMRNLILFGHKGSGKSFFGKLLAEKLRYEFIDTDLEVEVLYENRFGSQATCREIYKKLGILGFRELESEIIKNLKSTNNTIIAVGGGTMLRPANQRMLEGLGTLVYLEVSKEVIRRRVFEGRIPAFLEGSDSEIAFERMYQERSAIFEGIDAYRVVLDGKNNDEILELFLERCAIF